MLLNIMCSDYNDMDMDMRHNVLCYALLRCNVMSYVICCDVLDDASYMLLFMDFHKYISRARMSESVVFFILLCLLACYQHQASYFQNPFLKQIQICYAIQCSSIYTLWPHNWCVCVYICVFLVTHSIYSLDWVACMVFRVFFCFRLSSVAPFLFTFTNVFFSFVFSFHFATACDNFVQYHSKHDKS